MLGEPPFDDVHALTGSLKLYFRELPEPLIPYDFFSGFVEAISKLKTLSKPVNATHIKQTASCFPPFFLKLNLDMWFYANLAHQILILNKSNIFKNFKVLRSYICIIIHTKLTFQMVCIRENLTALATLPRMPHRAQEAC